MRYWKTPSSLLAAISITISCTLSALWLLAGTVMAETMVETMTETMAGTMAGTMAETGAQTTLKPYQALYSIKVRGFSADMEQTLSKNNQQQWQLSSYASVLFADIKESATFSEVNNQITPHSYNYANQLSSKKNSQLVFNPEQQTVFDGLHSQKDLPLPKNSYDRLSFQAQLYLDVINSAGFTEKTYHLVDRNELKTYQVSKLAEETIATPLGTFNALKLKQSRSGRDDYTLIWLAKDWDYFLLRIKRITEDKKGYQLNLKSAIVDGKRLTAKE